METEKIDIPETKRNRVRKEEKSLNKRRLSKDA